MNNLRIILLFSFFAISSIVQGAVVSRVEFQGLKNTNRKWLLGYIRGEAAAGMDESRLHLSVLKQRLLELELFERVTVSLEKRTGVVHVSVEEKASFLPVPIIAVSEGSTLFGFYLGEMNFLGMGKMLYLGGRYASYGTELQLGLIDPAFLSRHCTLSLTMEGGGVFYTQRDSRRNVYSKYLVDKVEILLSFGYRITKELQLKYAASWMDRSVRLDAGNFNEADPAGVMYQGFGLEFNGITFSDYRKLGLEVQLTMQKGFVLKGSGTGHYSHRLSSSFTFLPWGDHQLQLGFEGGYGNRPEIIAQRIGGARGFRTLPMEEVTADDFYSFIVQYEFPVLSFYWGVFTLLGFGETGQLRHRGGGWSDFYGFGGGFRMYLRKVAIPAMGLDVAWNPLSKSSEFSFSVGMKL